MGIGDAARAGDLIHVRGFQEAVIDVLKALQFSVLGVNQQCPVKCRAGCVPAVAAGVLEVVSEVGAIDQQLFWHTAAHYAGPTDPAVFNNGNALAVVGGGET